MGLKVPVSQFPDVALSVDQYRIGHHLAPLIPVHGLCQPNHTARVEVGWISHIGLSTVPYNSHLGFWIFNKRMTAIG